MDLPESGIYEELDLVAISIGADLVELQGENRIMASQGLKQLRKRQRPGILALLRAADIHQAPQTIRDISFTLGPRINAAGRMDHAQRVVDLLMEKRESRAAEVAREIEEMNQQRREVDEATTASALKQLETSASDSFVNLVHGKDWHRGVVGIVASRMIEQRYRPSIVLSEENGALIGSARSVHGVDIHQALESCEDLLQQFGGHPMAAGLSLKVEQLAEFKKRINDAIALQLNNVLPKPLVRCDREVHISELSLEAWKELQQLEPFGPGNPYACLYPEKRRLCAATTDHWQSRSPPKNHRRGCYRRLSDHRRDWLEYGRLGPAHQAKHARGHCVHIGQKHVEASRLAEPNRVEPSPESDSEGRRRPARIKGLTVLKLWHEP